MLRNAPLVFQLMMRLLLFRRCFIFPFLCLSPWDVALGGIVLPAFKRSKKRAPAFLFLKAFSPVFIYLTWTFRFFFSSLTILFLLLRSSTDFSLAPLLLFSRLCLFLSACLYLCVCLPPCLACFFVSLCSCPSRLSCLSCPVCTANPSCHAFSGRVACWLCPAVTCFRDNFT